MMPKGVEHNNHPPYGRRLGRVRIPMMPKGVEHKDIAAMCDQVWPVRIPMMPKGVEHIKLGGVLVTSADRENSDDAERR